MFLKNFTIVMALVSSILTGAIGLGAQENVHPIREVRVPDMQLEAGAPFLNYKTLSDSSGWDRFSLGGGHDAGLSSFLYGPEFFASYNSAYPFGMNDGVLRQGVGLNSSLSAGVRLGAYGFEANLKPVVAWEENRGFDIMESAYPNEYGYFRGAGVDLPQRFGDEAHLSFDWGDTELRYSWQTLTLGFGTQAVWIGPGRLNAIILSDNAPSFPKLDFGVRRTITPVGDVEARLLWGYLSESDFFDDESSNDHNSLFGLSISYQPVFFPELTLGFHRTILGKWNEVSPYDPVTLFIPLFSKEFGRDTRDQRASLTMDILFPAVGFECWVEWARNDYTGDLDKVLRYPFHSQAYTIGMRKIFDADQSKGISIEVLGEITNLESSRDYEFLGGYYFYGHHIITQGYTNGGQILGAGIQGGGNSQYLGITVYRDPALIRVYVLRVNVDNDYVFFLHTGQPLAEKRADEFKFNAVFSLGTELLWNASTRLCIGLGLAYCPNLNPQYNPDGIESAIIQNYRLSVTADYTLGRDHP